MVQGIKLDDYLSRHGPVPPGKAARIALEVLKQVQGLAEGGSSRSLSGIGPGRILISPDGRVVLLEPEDEIAAAVSAPAYASPEEVRGAAPDLRSAVYSVGCALFEILTGQAPFQGEDDRAVLAAHLSRTPPDADALRADIPPALSAAVASFLAKDPAARPQGPTEAAQALRAALGPGKPRPPAARAAPAPSVRPPARPAAAPRYTPLVPRAGSPQRAGAPARPLHPGLSSRPGRAMGRRSAGRFADPEADPRAKAPAARRPWIFTWFGLALGIVLCLIMVANRFRDVPEPPPPELSQLDKEQSESLRKAFRRTLDDDERIASSELEKLPTLRLSLKDRAETMSGVLDQYAHTAVAPKIADAISKLQASVEEQANSVEGGAPETPSPGEGAGSAEPPPAPGEPPAPAAEGKKEESPDDIGAKAGGDDGKGDL